jgi:hypothetical protein
MTTFSWMHILTCVTMERLTLRKISGLFILLSAPTFVEVVAYFVFIHHVYHITPYMKI